MYKLFKIDCTTVKNKLGNNLKEFFLCNFNNMILAWIVSERGGARVIQKFFTIKRKEKKEKKKATLELVKILILREKSYYNFDFTENFLFFTLIFFHAPPKK